ncbi:MAG: glycoside hydrolase family 13 protein [Firmicutes bacterium]|nr:glycoside hydrolase family 13 protein [Bacillota bacterium]
MEVQNYINKVLTLYDSHLKYLNIDAVFSDETEKYVSPVSPKEDEYADIYLRVYKGNIDSAYICTQYMMVKMRKDYTKGVFDYYRGRIKFGKDKLSYYFAIQVGQVEYFYNHQGVVSNINENFNFCIIPEFETPDWAKGAVMYQIYVDRFFKGSVSNDVLTNEYCYLGVKSKSIKNWDEPLENLDVCNFYGGDLQGVSDKLEYLSSFGVEAIYLNPIFVSPSNHKYDTQDYDNIDPHYGTIINDGGQLLSEDANDNALASKYMIRSTDRENLAASNALFAEVVKKAHSLNIKVILDGVFNHCGAFNKWLDREGFYEKNGYPVGAYKHKDSIYHNFFKWHNENEWPDNESYDSWWAHSNHPKLNYEQSPELVEYIMSVAEKWLSPPYCCDGWRLDVAADLGFTREYNLWFWEEFRQRVKKVNPDAIIIAEHYGDPQPWLDGKRWDTVMNYDAFMEPITWFLTGMEKHSEREDRSRFNDSSSFENAMRYYSSRFSYQSLFVSMNELSNHDHSRFLTRTNRKVGRLHTNGSHDADTGTNIGIMREAITYQMTWPGAPTIYYGDEAGMTGWTDPDNRRTYPWGRENWDIKEYYRLLIKIHKQYDVFKYGSTDYLYMNYGIICFGRWTTDQRAIVVLNNNEEEKYVNVPAWRAEAAEGDVFVNAVTSGLNGWYCDPTEYKVENGCITVAVPAYGSIVLINSDR